MKWVIFPILFVLCILFSLPFLASTPLGKPLFVKAFEKKIGGKVEIGSLSLSWLGPQKYRNIVISSPDLTGRIEELQSDVPFWTLTQIEGAFTIRNGSFSFPQAGNGTIENVNGEISGNNLQLTGITRQNGSNGQISIQGPIYSRNHFDITVDLTNFPVYALDHLFQGHRLVYAALGTSINLKGKAQIQNNQGTIDLDLSSNSIRTQIQANLTETAIQLRHPLTASLQLTPEMSSALLSEINPLFLTGLEGKNPILLHLDSLFYPLPFSLEKFQATGTLDLGKVRCRNGKSLASIISLLKTGASPVMNAWFTPLTFQISNGTAYTDRLDALLADSIHVCTWGRINLVEDRIHMYLGLPADTLQRSFGIQNLPASYVLKIPIRGSTQDPDIETGPAAAKIAALVASQQLPLKKKGVLGGLINVFSTVKEDKDVPPPKRPFPWE